MVEIRPIGGDEEVEAALALWFAVLPRHAHTAAERADHIGACDDWLHVIALEDGALAGFGFVTIEGSRRNPRVMIVVDPERRRRGIGTTLLDAVRAWSVERGHDEIEMAIGDDQEAALAFARRFGFERFVHEQMLELDLAAIDPPAVAPPPGVEIVRWSERPDSARGMYEVALEAYPDVPGDEDEPIEPFAGWLAHDMQGSGDRPEATFVAFAGEEVVGYSKFHLMAAQPTVAMHDITGVKRAWRGRGIAAALKAAQIAWAKEQGYERLTTLNEDNNAPIQKLNARFGYRPGVGRSTWRGPAAP